MTRLILLAATTLAVLAALTSACGSSGDSPAVPSATPVKSAIIKVLPRDASAEPPWNGRFVQVNVRVPRPSTMDPADWRVFVNGKQPELDTAASILPYSASEAVVAFMFRTPYGDPGTYEFRVVYAPKDGKKLQSAWNYRW